MTTGAATATIYPETDGMPLPDGEFQAPLYIRIVGTLRTHFGDIPGARVNGDTFIYYIEGNPRRSVSPDCYVALDLSADALESIERNNIYLLWEVGKAPDFILEIGSHSTSGADLGRKRDLYAEIGVSEYWRYDKTGGEFYGEPLVGEYLVDGEYRRFDIRSESDERVWSHSEALNMDLWWVEGELRFWDPVSGRWLLSQDEERAGRLEAEARADDESKARRIESARAERAEAERDSEAAARRHAETELSILRERLKELGETE